MSIIKNKALRILLVLVFAFITCFTLFACGGGEDPGDGDGGGYMEPDYSSNNPEYVRFRDVINIITKTYGIEVSTGAENTLAQPDDYNQGGNDGGVNNAFSKTTTFDEIKDTAKTYLDSLKTKEPDTSYNDAAIVFESISTQCFKMPVYMGEIITQYMGATSIYNKTMLVGHDRDDQEDVYYRIEQNENNLISYAYTKNGFEWEGETPIVTDNYYMYYTEVNFIDEDNFTFVCITTSEDNSFANLMYGDNKCNMLHISYTDNSIENAEVYYTYGDMTTLRTFNEDSTILTQAITMANNIISQVDVEYLDEIASEVLYYISHENFKKVINRINQELGYGSSSNNAYEELYPGWRIRNNGVVEGYFGVDNKFCDLEVLEIPSEFTAIASDFVINGSVDKLIIPSTITSVMEYDYATNEYTIQKNVKDLVITCLSTFGENRTTHAIKEIEIKEINGQESTLLSIGNDKNLYSNDGSTLLYICDTPDTAITEYNFAGKQMGRKYSPLGYSDGSRRENFSNIKKISVDCIYYQNEATGYETRRYIPILDRFVEYIDNFNLEELNIYNFNEISNEYEDKDSYLGEYLTIYNGSSIKQKLNFNIKNLNIYGNVKKLNAQSSKFENVYDYAKMNSSTLDSDVETIKANYEIYNSYDLEYYLESPYEYLEDRNLFFTYEQILELNPNFSMIEYEEYLLITSEEIKSNTQILRAKYLKDYLVTNPNASISYWQNITVPSGCELNWDMITEITTDLVSENNSSGSTNLSHRRYPNFEKINVPYGSINPEIYMNDLYKTVDVYFTSAIISLKLSAGSLKDYVLAYDEDNNPVYQEMGSLFAGTISETNPVVKLHLPWTKETFYNSIVKNGNSWAVNDTDLTLEDNANIEYSNGIKLVFAETDDTTKYSFPIYEMGYIYNAENTYLYQGEVVVGYYTNDSTITTLTLPDTITMIPNQFTIYAPNITKLVIPNSITEVLRSTTGYGQYKKELQVTTFNLIFKTPDTFKEYILQEIEVEEGSTLFKTTSNGMKLESYDGNHLLYLCDQAVETLDLRYVTIPSFVYIGDNYISEDSKSELYVNLATTLKTVNIYYVFEMYAGSYYIDDVQYWKTTIRFNLSLRNAYNKLVQNMNVENLHIYNISATDAIVINPEYDIFEDLTAIATDKITSYSLEELLQEGFTVDLNGVVLNNHTPNIYLYGNGFTIAEGFTYADNIYVNGQLQE